MYVMEYLLYHLRPYGIDSEVRFEKSNNDKSTKQSNTNSDKKGNGVNTKDNKDSDGSSDNRKQNDTIISDHKDSSTEKRDIRPTKHAKQYDSMIKSSSGISEKNVSEKLEKDNKNKHN